MRRMTLWCVVAAALWGLAFEDLAEARCRRRCGCSDPYVRTTAYRPISPSDYVAPQAMQAPVTPGLTCLAGPTTELQIVLVSAPATEMRTVCSTEYRDEQRSRVVTGFKTIPVTEERIRVSTVMTPVTETKMVTYTNQVAVQGEEVKTYRIKVPVWADEEETYTVKVPVLREVEENYTVKVPVLRDVPFTFTVNVPQPITRVVNRTVSNVVPVVKTRAINICTPVSRTRSVAVDRGHWENQIIEGSVGRRGGYAPQQRRVWVPNVITEEVTDVAQQQSTTTVEYVVYEQHFTTVPHECVCIEYRPEARQGTKKEVAYQDEIRTRTRTAVAYEDEARTRLKKVLTFREEERTETYPVVSFKPEAFSKEVAFTVYVPETKEETYTVTRMDQVPDHRIENYTVKVAVPVTREVEVQVARMIPRVVAVTVNPCGGRANAGGQPIPGAAPPAAAPPGEAPAPPAAAPPVAVIPARNVSRVAAAVPCCGAK